MKKPTFKNFRKPLHRVNSQIRNEEVRVLLDDGEQLGVMKTQDAINVAKDRKMDLVEIAPNNNLTKSFFPSASLKVSPCHAINAVIITKNISIYL